MRVGREAGKTLEQAIAFYSKGTQLLSRHDVPNQPAASGCSGLTEVISKGPPIPREDMAVDVPDVVNTDFFCESQSGFVIVILRSWEDDKRQNAYQLIALTMAKSIKTLHQ